MAELSFPSAGGGSITDATYERLIGSYAPSGIVGTASQNALVYGDGTGLQVKVRASQAAIVRGFRWETDGAGITRAIEANSSGQTRIDLAVLRLNRADWTVTFQVVKGTPAATPAPPAVTQQTGSTGVWELPLARITVANGAVTILPANVADYGVYISQFTYSGKRSGPPSPALNPQFFHAIDVGRTYSVIGGGYQIVGEAGDLVRITSDALWSTSSMFVRRWNGFVHMQATLTRTGSRLAADTTSRLAILPAVYRPMNDLSCVAYAGGTAMACYVNATNGGVYLTNYTIPFETGATLTIHPLVWAANNIEA